LGKEGERNGIYILKEKEPKKKKSGSGSTHGFLCLGEIIQVKRIQRERKENGWWESVTLVLSLHENFPKYWQLF